MVLVTGGLGAIGMTACRMLSDAGATVVANDIHPDSAARELLPDGVRYVRGDGRSSAGASELIDRAFDAGTLTDVVLLAGKVHSAPLLDQTAEAAEDVLRLNLIAPMVTAQTAVRRWKAADLPGNLVFVSSWVQDVPWPGVAPYAASKAALRSMARSFAREFATAGIRANVVAPGIVGAGMAAKQWDEEPDFRARARRAVPLGRLQPPESVGDALVFLCSSMSSYMTGSTLLVDGGASLYPLDEEEVPQ